MRITILLYVLLLLAVQASYSLEEACKVERNAERLVITLKVPESLTGPKVQAFMNPPRTNPLASELLKVKGVNWIIMRPGEINIYVSSRASCDEVEKQVVEIVERHLKQK